MPQAQPVVTQAGGVLRAVDENGAMTSDYRPDRVTVILDHAGHVIKTLGLAPDAPNVVALK